MAGQVMTIRLDSYDKALPQLSESMFANGADCVIPSGLALSAKHDAIFSKGGQVDKSEADTND